MVLAVALPTLVGEWVDACGLVGTIGVNNDMAWEEPIDDVSTPLGFVPACDGKSSSAVWMQFMGERLYGRLECDMLHWSNGDVWRRVSLLATDRSGLPWTDQEVVAQLVALQLCLRTGGSETHAATCALPPAQATPASTETSTAHIDSDSSVESETFGFPAHFVPPPGLPAPESVDWGTGNGPSPWDIWQDTAPFIPSALGKLDPDATLTQERCERSGCLRIRWMVASSKFGSSNKVIVSPDFDINLLGSRNEFKLMLVAKVVHSGRGGASFAKAKGCGTVQLKCSSTVEAPRGVYVRVSVGAGDHKVDGPLWEHDFSQVRLAACPHEWEFMQGVAQDCQDLVPISLEVWA